MKELKTDPELKNLLPPLTDEEYSRLEKNILENGFDRNFPIMEWHGYIADGHNRYSICKEHKIEPVIGTLAYDTKEEVMEWMLDIQLGRRNLSPIQRIAVAEKYRPIYEKQAALNKSLNGGDKKSELQNSSTPVSKENKVDVRAKLAKTASVSTDTYSKGKKILDSNNEELKQEVLSGQKSINAGYKELTQNQNKKKSQNEKLSTCPESLQKNEKEIVNEEINNTKPATPKSRISEEVKQICADLKTEKTKEYLDSIWNYKVDFIECMNADADLFFDTLRSHFDALNNLVTEKELKECINAAKKVVETISQIIKQAEMSTKTKSEDNKHVN